MRHSRTPHTNVPTVRTLHGGHNLLTDLFTPHIEPLQETTLRQIRPKRSSARDPSHAPTEPRKKPCSAG